MNTPCYRVQFRFDIVTVCIPCSFMYLDFALPQAYFDVLLRVLLKVNHYINRDICLFLFFPSPLYPLKSLLRTLYLYTYMYHSINEGLIWEHVLLVLPWRQKRCLSWIFLPYTINNYPDLVNELLPYTDIIFGNDTEASRSLDVVSSMRRVKQNSL